MDEINDTLISSIKIITMMLLIIGGKVQAKTGSGRQRHGRSSPLSCTNQHHLTVYGVVYPYRSALHWVQRPLRPLPQAASRTTDLLLPGVFRRWLSRSVRFRHLLSRERSRFSGCSKSTSTRLSGETIESTVVDARLMPYLSVCGLVVVCCRGWWFNTTNDR